MWHFIAVFLRQRIVQVSAFFLIGFVVERLATADRSITKATELSIVLTRCSFRYSTSQREACSRCTYIPWPLRCQAKA